MARLKLKPFGKASLADYKAFFDQGINHESRHRVTRFRTWERCRLYGSGDQWLEGDRDNELESRIGITPYWKPRQVTEKNWIPMPVQNEFPAPIQNEVARLLGVGSKPYVRPTGSDTMTVKGADLGRDALRNRLEELNWLDTQHRALHSMVSYGTMILKSWWELDYTKTVRAAVKGAMKCPSCGFVLSAPTTGLDKIGPMLEERPQIGTRIEVVEETVTVNGCLSCDDDKWENYSPSEEEAVSGKDAFGRPLGEDLPLGDTALSVVSVYEFFPQNSGVGKTDEKLEEWFEEHVESVDWVRAHYKNGYKVRPDSSKDIIKYHPGFGSILSASGDASLDGLYDDHVIVKEWHKKPWVEPGPNGEPVVTRGRSIVYAGGVVLLDADYLLPNEDGETEDVARVQYVSVPWEIRDGEVFGIGASEYMFSGQDIINTTLSQVQHARHHFGSPKILAPRGMDLEFAGVQDSGYDGDIYYFTPQNPGEAPIPFGNVQMAQNWISEVQEQKQSINRMVGTMDVEIGATPGKDLTAASAIMYLGEKAAERRKARIERVKSAKKKLYRHQLQLIQKYYREDRLYPVLGQNDKWSVRSFKGLELAGQTDVQFEDEPYYDVRMFRREVIKDALQAGTITPDTAAAKRKINREWGVPLEINEDQNNQVKWAEEEWFRFIGEGKDPSASPRSDDPIIHYQCHELSWASDEGMRLRDACDWGEIELALWGWEEQLQALEAIEEQLRLPPPAAPTPGPDGQLDTASVEQYPQLLQARADMEQKIAGYPKAPELRIYMIWTKMLSGLAIDPARVQPATTCLRWRAHVEAHYLQGQRQAMAAQAGIAMPAAPSAASTTSGLVPSPGQVALPGAGSGPGATTASGDGV